MYSVYALAWPFDGPAAYVGCTSYHPIHRWAQHTYKPDTVAVRKFTEKLRDYGLVPRLLILDTDIPTKRQALDLEQHWISAIEESSGASLLNTKYSDRGKKISKSLKAYFSNPDVRKKNGERQKEVYRQNPDLRKKASKIAKQWHSEHPEFGTAHSLRTRGSNHPKTKLTEQQVVEIRRALMQGVPEEVILAQYPVTPYALVDIRLGRTWRHVEVEGWEPIHRPSKLGELNPNSKLTNAQAREIRLRLQQGETRKTLAEEFGISDSAVGNIKHRVTYKK